ncbi:MAG: hypothetical protein JOZ16_14685 [Methylobacteriaceae bacterium]|nr:hypothetical protein [Methylobacteriaceae bacterium]
MSRRRRDADAARLLRFVPMSAGRPTASKFRLGLIVLAALFAPTRAFAFDHAWHCLPRAEFEKFEVREDKLILDYILVREQKGTLSGLPVVTFSYSVVNKQDRNIHIDAQLVGLDAEGVPVLGISASPPSSLVASQASRSVANSVYVAAGQLNRAAKLCVSFGGDF